jgi:hypothetical protein
MKGKTIILKSQEPRITANVLKSRFKIIYDFNAPKSTSDYTLKEGRILFIVMLYCRTLYTHEGINYIVTYLN